MDLEKAKGLVEQALNSDYINSEAKNKLQSKEIDSHDKKKILNSITTETAFEDEDSNGESAIFIDDIGERLDELYEDFSQYSSSDVEWNVLTEDDRHSTIATFKGGYSTGDVEVLVWRAPNRRVGIKEDGEVIYDWEAYDKIEVTPGWYQFEGVGISPERYLVEVHIHDDCVESKRFLTMKDAANYATTKIENHC